LKAFAYNKAVANLAMSERRQLVQRMASDYLLSSGIVHNVAAGSPGRGLAISVKIRLFSKGKLRLWDQHKKVQRPRFF